MIAEIHYVQDAVLIVLAILLVVLAIRYARRHPND